MNLKIFHRNQTVAEYNELRRLAEWPVLDEALVQKGLANSLFSVVILDEHDILMGMGRVIGDGAIYLHIQDVIVRPGFQRQGIGKLIMNELLRYTEATGGTNTNIGLMASKGREEFYKNLGFTERPNEKFGAGMIRIKS